MRGKESKYEDCVCMHDHRGEDRGGRSFASDHAFECHDSDMTPLPQLSAKKSHKHICQFEYSLLSLSLISFKEINCDGN